MCTQDEINLIIGGNAARLYKLDLNPLITFCSGRPDLWVPSLAEMEQEAVRTGYSLPDDCDYIPNTFGMNK